MRWKWLESYRFFGSRFPEQYLPNRRETGYGAMRGYEFDPSIFDQRCGGSLDTGDRRT
jgi:hypothetical protein